MSASHLVTDNSHFHNLPNEVLSEIFSYLDNDSKLTCRCVCWKWKQVLDTIFFIFHGILSDASLTKIINATVKFETLRIHDFLQPLLSKHCSQSRSGLAIGPKRIIFQRKSNGEHEKSSGQSSVSVENLMRILRCNRDILCLTFEKHSLLGMGRLHLQGLCMKQLKCMEMDISEDPNGEEGDALMELAKIKKPDLLGIELRFHSDLTFNRYLKLFQFIGAHAKNLEQLNLQFNCVHASLNNGRSQKDRTLIRNLKKELAANKIDQLKIKLPYTEGHSPYTLGVHLLASLNLLTFLEVTIPTDGHSKIVLRRIKGCIERSSETLICFTMRRNSLAEITAEIQLILGALSSCTRLRSVQLYLYTFHDMEIGLPRTLTNLALVGDIGPDVLRCVAESLRNLRELQFANLGDVTEEGRAEFAVNFRRILRMPELRRLKFYSEGFDVSEFESEGSNLVVERCSPNVNVYCFT